MYNMTEKEREKSFRKKSKTDVWLVAGLIVLIVLLLIWLTVADLLGDTDVAAFIAPGLS